MNKPIIDPSTLTEEQREAIRNLYDDFNQLELHGASITDRSAGRNQCITLEWLFGSDFFKKGE